MNKQLPILVILVLLFAFALPNCYAQKKSNFGIQENLYPCNDKRIKSPGHITYYVNPDTGSDSNSGRQADKAWETFAKINRLELSPGDKIVVAPGVHIATLKPFGEGVVQDPIIVEFSPGMHVFVSEKLMRRPYYVSNSTDNPEHPLPIAIFVENTKHLHFHGSGVEGEGKTTLLLAGPERSTYFVNDHAEDIVFVGLAFDLKRPTVSEFRVMETDENSVIIKMAEGSTYEVKDDKFVWTGDIGKGWMMSQRAILENGRCMRLERLDRWDPFLSAKKIDDLGDCNVRLSYAKGTYNMHKGHQFQFRPVVRDVVTAHNTRCKNIVMRDCDIYALTGMGIVSQFTDGLTFERVRMAPEKGSIRTCPAWADMLHISGCRGRLLVNDCVFSGCQDDPINIHGTYLRIIEKLPGNKVRIRFMHGQTYGFETFFPGDEVALVRGARLKELGRNKVVAAKMNGKKEMIVTLEKPITETIGDNDVLENITWNPDVLISNCYADASPTYGFVIKSRGSILVENCTFRGILMASIALAQYVDAFWYESCTVHNAVIRNNRFLSCYGTPVTVNPGHKVDEDPVNRNIRIEDNYFEDIPGTAIMAKSVRGLTVSGNRTTGNDFPVKTTACTGVKIEGTVTNCKRCTSSGNTNKNVQFQKNE